MEGKPCLQQKLEGTAGAVDAAIAEILWRRSEQRHGFRYVTVLSDESLHSVIWRKCLKTDFLGKLRVEAGADIAVSDFNQGTEKTVAETTAALGFQLGEAQVTN